MGTQKDSRTAEPWLPSSSPNRFAVDDSSNESSQKQSYIFWSFSMVLKISSISKQSFVMLQKVSLLRTMQIKIKKPQGNQNSLSVEPSYHKDIERLR